MTAARPDSSILPVAVLAPLFAALFLFGTETFVVSLILPSIASEIGASIPATASAAAAYVLVYAALAPVLSYCSDAIDRRATLVAGLLVFVLGNVVAAGSQGLYGFVGGRALSGLGAAMAGPAIWSSLVVAAPPALRSRVIGFGMASFSIGQVVGVPAGGLLTGTQSWRIVFLAIAALAALIALAGIVAAQHLGSPADRAADTRFRLFSVWRDGTTSRTLVLTMLFHAANLGAYAYVGAMLSSRFSLGTGEIGLAGLAVGAGSVLGALLAGKLGDQARRRRKSESGRLPLWGAILAVSLAATALAPTPTLAFLFLGVWFVGSGAYVTDSQAIVTSSSATSRALASAWNTTSMHLGTAAGVFVLGAFSGRWAVLFGAASAVAGLAVAYAAAILRSDKQDQDRAGLPEGSRS